MSVINGFQSAKQTSIDDFQRNVSRPLLPLNLVRRSTKFDVDDSVASGEGTPYDGLYGEAPPERGNFFRLQVYERLGILLFEVCERMGKSVIWVCERAQRANR